MEHDIPQALDFLGGLQPDMKLWRVFALAPGGSPIHWPHGTDLGKWIKDQNSEDKRAGIFVQVNQARKLGKAEAKDITACNALHIDIDGKGFPGWPEKRDEIMKGILKELDGLKVQASAVVCSGNGYHAYWFLREPSTDKALVRELNVRLVSRLGGDPACVNVDRFLRVPGTFNWKDSGTTYCKTESLKDWRRDLEDLDKFLPAATAQERASSVDKDNDPEVLALKKFLSECVPTKPENLNELCIKHNIPTTVALAASGEFGGDFLEDVEKRLGGDRSHWLFKVCCEFLRQDVPPEVLLGHLLDAEGYPTFHAHLKDSAGKRNLRKYAERQVWRALASNLKRTAGEKAVADVLAPVEAEEDEKVLKIKVLKAHPLPGVREWLSPGFLMYGHITLLSGRGGDGKSLLALQTAVSVAARVESCFWTPYESRKVLYVCAEDDLDEVKRRLYAIQETLGVTDEDIAGRLFLVVNGTLYLVARNEPTEENPGGKIELTALAKKLAKHIKEHDIGLVILDPLIEMHIGLDENSNADMANFIVTIREMCRKTKAAFLIVHHSQEGLGSGRDGRRPGQRSRRLGDRKRLPPSLRPGAYDR